MQISESPAAPTDGDHRASRGGLEGDGTGVQSTAANREGSVDDAAGAASGDSAATRLWRATEAARELGLSCAP